MTIKINISEIQEATFVLLARLAQSKGNEIELDSDYYWDISVEELYDPYDSPKNISLGQLSDDLNEIRKALHSDSVIPYDLKRLAEILKALSIENQTAF